MMAVIETKTPAFFAAFEADRREEPEWLAERRQLALERFTALGFPTTKHEDYKYTNLAPIARAEMRRPKSFDGQPDLRRVEYLGEEAARIVFVDGRFYAVDQRTEGFTIGSLRERIAAGDDRLIGHLTRYANVEDHALTALNTALFEDGAFVQIPDKAVVEKPIHIVYVATGAAHAMSHPRTLILAGGRSQAAIVESYVGLSDGPYWTNPVTEIVAEAAARIDHYKAQQESKQAFHTGLVEMLLERGGWLSNISLSFGGALTRNDINIKLNDEGCECALDGLFVVNGKQHVDHHTTIDHAMPHCNSHQLYKGVLGDATHGVFNGKIIVRKDAQKTDAIQNNKNLLLSRKAEIDTKPQLEIDANDVRCTHGATIGQLDKDALFYLQSRGLSRDRARSLLTYAFAADLLERVRIEPLRDHFERMLMRSLSADPAAEETHR